MLLCLHGYGESETSFHFLEVHLPPQYQLIAIDLPFHGKTAWDETTDFTVQDLLQIIDHILAERGRSGDPITLLGFSMGGRMALSILQAMPHRIDKIILLAPDGLKVNFWYWLATQTAPGIRLFRFTMDHPGWFFGVLQVGHRMRLINRSVHKFTSNYVDNKTLRRELYRRWTGLRRIKPDLPVIKQKAAEHNISIDLVYGEFDRIIRHERGAKFRQGIESYCRLQVIKSGHQLLHQKNAALIAGLL